MDVEKHSLVATLLRDMIAQANRLPAASIAVGIAVFTTVFLLADNIRSWYRLSHVPGPFWAAFTKYWMIRQSLKGHQPYAIQSANEKYGKKRSLSDFPPPHLSSRLC